jgi:hypothetical protein
MNIYTLGIIVGLGIGWMRRGSLVALGRTPFRLAWLLLISFAANSYIVRMDLDLPWWVGPLHLGAYALALAVLLVNRRLPGVPLLALGLAMNVLVIALNGGMMPQAPQTLQVMHPGKTFAIGQHPPKTKTIVLPREQTRLWWLSDVLVTPSWSPLRTVASVGDVVIVLGLAWTVQGLMQPGRHQGQRPWMPTLRLPTSLTNSRRETYAAPAQSR